ncbi:MAG: hypothetical protein Fur0032_01470 [Terrimicrobiaceae bacterium]
MGRKGAVTPLGGYYPRTFLATVLQGEETIIGQHGGIRMAEDCEHTTLVGWFVTGRLAGHGIYSLLVNADNRAESVKVS